MNICQSNKTLDLLNLKAYESYVRKVLHVSPTHLSTSSDCNLLEDADVINKDVHETKLITESHKDIESGWMKSDTVCFFLKHFIKLKRAEIIKIEDYTPPSTIMTTEKQLILTLMLHCLISLGPAFVNKSLLRQANERDKWSNND